MPGRKRSCLTVSTQGFTATLDAEVPTPLPGGTSATRPVTVQYQLNGDALFLSNNPADGNFSVVLHVKVTDCAGTMLEALQSITFVGQIAVIGGGYKERFLECMRQWINETRVLPNRPIAPWVPIDHPAPETLLAFAISVARSGAPTWPVLLAQAKAAHGASWYGALSTRLSSALSLPPSFGTERLVSVNGLQCAHLLDLL